MAYKLDWSGPPHQLSTSKLGLEAGLVEVTGGWLNEAAAPAAVHDRGGVGLTGQLYPLVLEMASARDGPNLILS